MSRIALIGENSVDYVNILLDIWNNGDCAVLLNPNTPLRSALQMMEDAGVTQCYIEEEIYNLYDSTEGEKINFKSFKNSHRLYPMLLPQQVYRKYNNNYSYKEAVIIYSSGTTGKAKGIILSHFAIQTNADSIIEYMELSKNDTFYVCKSLTHSSTLVGELLVALKTGAGIVLASTFVSPKTVLKRICMFNITILCLNPTLLELYSDEYINNPLKDFSLRVIYVSGAPLNKKLYKKAHLAWGDIPIYNVYGLTEAGPRVSAQSIENNRGISVGKPIRNVQAIVVDSCGSPVPDGECGILHINTPSIYSGYVTGGEKNKSLYHNWLNTGDIGLFDSCGELYILNRVDEVIELDSHKIYPGDIENIILNEMSISECKVIGLKKDERKVLGCLYVSEVPIDTEIRMKLKKKLLAWEIPQIYLKCPSIPKNQNGKISDADLRIYIRSLNLGYDL